MKTLVLYRSYHGNTKQIAEAMSRQIQELGHVSSVQDLRRKLPELQGLDLILIGAPTRMARVTRKALSVLKSLRKRGFGDKPVAIFDTYGPLPATPEELEKSRPWIIPGAVGIMEKTAKDQGLNVYGQTLRCEVLGMNGPLKEHEQEKATTFAKELISSVAGNRV